MALYRGELERRFQDATLQIPEDLTPRSLRLDFETFCELNLKAVGLDLYSSHPSCEVLMAAYSIDDGPIEQWDATEDERIPRDLRDALDDPSVIIYAFNAQFERIILERVLGRKIAYERFKCAMVLAYFHSFVGGLEQVAEQCGLSQDKQKSATGKKLMAMFSWPQKPTKNQPLRRFDSLSHPVEWKMYLDYNRQDVVAETALWKRLDRPQYPIPQREWDFYHLDQKINDRGLPIDRVFITNAIRMSAIRKDVLSRALNELTGLQNGNSPAQLLPWLQERGYPFSDLQKDSIKKVLTAHEGVKAGLLVPGEPDVLAPILTDDCVKGLKLRAQSARTSTSKYIALKVAMGDDARMRFVFQFAGASRTARFAGRRFQPQNLTMMRDIEDIAIIEMMTNAIRDNDYDAIELFRAEPLDALAGLVRSSVRARPGKHLVVCDLASIESVVIGWVSNCERLLNVFRDGKDAYKDFATELFDVLYEEVTKQMRKKAKPATLGAGYRLGGGEIIDGKKTGLWGYGENMGIDLTREESHKSVATFRRVYKEIPETWYALEKAIMKTIRTHATTTVGPISFSYAKPYLIAHLPSGRCIFYKDPRITKTKFRYFDKKENKWAVTIKDSISYMGKRQTGNGWVRVFSHGGKFIENLVQAIARDILREGLMLLDEAGFNLIGHVHDEAIAEETIGSKFNWEAMKAIMAAPIKWAKGMPLNAAGFHSVFYLKD